VYEYFWKDEIDEDVFLVPEADMPEAAIHPADANAKQQTMTFSDGSPGAMDYIVTTGSDNTRTSRYSDDVGLKDFLSRPIKIDTRDWQVNANTHHQFDPWTRFFKNKRVINRLNNYNIMRATLKLKFVINGNGFYYGRAIASYLPHEFWDDLSQNRSTVKEDIVQASQLPHVFIDPTTSTGGTLTLPFMYYYDFINTTDGAWNKLGTVVLRSINELAHANGGTDAVTITTFAWAEDVELAVPTSVDAEGLVPQADMKLSGGDETDEANKTGMISGPATSLASAAARLKKIPSLSPYASATEVGASMVASVAKVMGYSRPPVTRAPDPMQPHNTASMALCTVPDVVNKLTVDDKQGLGMGSEIAGIMSSDPMSIASIAQRESYVTTFEWPTDAAPDQLIWNTRVHPSIYARASTSPPELHLPALAVAALPFQYWTGTIKLRFQIVCSAFHRGRLRVVYDPNYLSPDAEYNVNYQEIIDVAEKQDFTVSITNGQERGILPIPRPAVELPSFTYGPTRLTNYRPSNGVVGIYVVNELVTPNTVVASDVQINMFVSAGDDFKVFSPWDDISHYEFVPQSDMDLSKVPDASRPSEPVSEESQPLSTDKQTVDEITAVYAGECIGSFRQLIRRYNKHSTLFTFSGTGLNAYTARRNSFPYLKGAANGAVDVSVDGPYNYAWTSVLQFITMCFAGWRGSIRHRIVPVGVGEADSRLLLVAQRVAQDGYANTVEPITAPSNLSVARFNGITGPQSKSCPHGSDGMALTTAVVNDILSFEVPYQMLFRYGISKTENLSGADAWCNAFQVTATCDAKTDGWCDWYVAAGEDFQVYFWTGMPPIYYDQSEPDPST
jgi:hypothetical protein